MRALDRGVAAFIATFVDGRAYPMFALLFGYGLARILDRQLRSGIEWKQARKLLRRHSLCLILPTRCGAPGTVARSRSCSGG